MHAIEKIRGRLLKKIPASYRRRLHGISRWVSIHRPKSLTPPYPSAITIDPVNACNLRCPLCPTGLRQSNQSPVFMSFDTFKIVLDKIPSLQHICLFNWGEPFLNPSIFEMIRYAKEKNIRVMIHSNFSIKKNDDFFLRILKSGLDSLVISLDGASQESYSKYRIGGDFYLVLSNIRTLVNLKKERRLQNPNMIWKFIVNRFNEKELADAEKIAEGLGIEFETSCLGLSDDLPGFDLKNTIQQRKEYWLPKNKQHQHPHYREEYRLPLMNTGCTQLFETLVVNPDGKVFPCCWVTSTEHAFGDLTKESMEEIWHNSKYLFSRSLFTKENYSGQDENTVCSICNNFQKMKSR